MFRNNNRPKLLRQKSFFSRTTIFISIGGIFLLIFIFRNFLDVRWNEVIANLKSVNLQLFFIAFLSYYLSFIVRGYRWKLICKSAVPNSNKNLPNTLSFSGIILMGWFANSIAFMRLGDAYRGWILSKEIDKSSFSTLIGTVIAERVQDILVIIFILLLSIFFIQRSNEIDLPSWIFLISVTLLLIVIAGISFLKKSGPSLEKLLPPKVRSLYSKVYKSILSGFSIRNLPTQFLLGCIGWILEILRFYFVAESINIDISIWIIVLTTLTSSILTTIPTPGGFGFVESGMAALLILFGLPDLAAVSLVTIDRIISWLSVIVFGGLLFSFWHIIKRPIFFFKK